MNADFSRILTLLRKERGLSQKQAAGELGISQALLSHYEKGIRECGLDFLVRAANFYGVSCDYLLGRSPERTGMTLTVEDIPDPDSLGKENTFRGSILPTLNKKLIANSLNILFDLLQKCNSKSLVTETSAYLMGSVYKMFRVIYSANPRNEEGMFGVSSKLCRATQMLSCTSVKRRCAWLLRRPLTTRIRRGELPSPCISPRNRCPRLIRSLPPLFSTSYRAQRRE